jgi:site-specific DNA-adenine methylase
MLVELNTPNRKKKMYINQMISRIKEVEEMLKNVEMNSEDYAQLSWELSC